MSHAPPETFATTSSSSSSYLHASSSHQLHSVSRLMEGVTMTPLNPLGVVANVTDVSEEALDLSGGGYDLICLNAFLHLLKQSFLFLTYIT